VACFSAVKLRMRLGWDDSLDVWGCHGVGGIVGSILTGVFATKSIGGFSGLIDGSTDIFFANIAATAIAAAFAFFMTYVLLGILKSVMHVSVDPKKEEEGLDRALHGEEAYAF
jgi:ammonium transporter, Amt family